MKWTVKAVGCLTPCKVLDHQINPILALLLYGHEPVGCCIPAGQPPPIEAYGAVIEGYAKQQDADAALAVLKAFFLLGGEADSRMYDIVVDVCVRTHKFQRALQVSCLVPC